MIVGKGQKAKSTQMRLIGIIGLGDQVVIVLLESGTDGALETSGVDVASVCGGG